MQYSFLKSCLVALAAVSGVVAQTAGFDAFTQPLTPGTSIPAGSTYTIKWTPSAPAGKVSIVLLQGSSNVTLQLGPTVVSGIDSTTGSYDWSVPSALTPAFAVYGLKIQLDSDPTVFQYSTYFSIGGLTTASASASGSTSVSASTTVTLLLSSVPATVVTSVTTLSPSLVTISNGTSSSTAGIYSNTTVTQTTASVTSVTSATGAAGTASLTSSSAVATKSSAAGNVAIGGTGLLGAMMVALGMLL